MTPLSRRAFLTLSGATLLAAALPRGLVRAAPTSPDALAGRALRAAPLLQQPAGGSPVVRYLWPDGVTPILEAVGDWYAVPGGFVRKTDVQPMLPYDPALALPAADLPAWLTVIAPLAPVRAWAAASAPLVARVGYGGVLRAVDRLRDDAGLEWYAVSAMPGGEPLSNPHPGPPPPAGEGAAPPAASPLAASGARARTEDSRRWGRVLGWSPAARWSAVADVSPVEGGAARVLRLDAARGQLRAWEDGREVLRAPVAVPPDARPGAWTLVRRSPTLPGPLPHGTPDRYGASWVLESEGPRLYGVCWHNAFGGPGDGPGWEAPPLVARWLYAWLPEGAAIEVQ